ncbi:DUF2490 domain-containing protein [Aestuariibaculum sp. M13]|uniref:DUF2490 domain-containing protein n=1 Tax=Aestuariibaculum sp. M13 TaxID=2967132 RepID=UPI002159C6CD|nr:DUF2490 domain-containing protein [Aestuariibaculum sp. M13]MCR8667425.1 DUF2490 domain-containing protein [Aestuariibaculum sp. M13]
MIVIKHCKVYVLLILLVLSFSVSAQVAAEKEGTYLYTGFSSALPGNNSFVFYYGYSPSDDFQSLIALPFFKITNNIQFMPGYMMTKADGYRMFTNVQHHLLPSVILNFKLSERFSITDRNMFYHLFREDTKDVNLYRNRLGLIYHTKLFKKATNLFIHDAMFWNLNNGKFFRNRIILGGSIKAAKWMTPQIWYAYQAENGLLPQHQFYLILTVPLENFGVFKSKTNN